MGYTHYLELKKKLSNNDCLAASKACAELLSRIPADRLEQMLEPADSRLGVLADANKFALSGQMGRLLEFCASQGQGFFVFPKNCESVNIISGEKYAFCKTSEPGEPGDSLVVALFLAAQHATGGRMRFSTDGMPIDLKKGLELYRDCTGQPGDISVAYANSKDREVKSQLDALRTDGLIREPAGVERHDSESSEAPCPGM